MSWDLSDMKRVAAEKIDAPAPAIPAGFRAVDAHVHLFPERLFEAIWKWFDEYGWNVLFKRPVPELLAYLRRMGVEKAFCLVYAHRAGMATELNRWLAELAAREPMVVPFGAFHQDDDADEVIGAALDTHGMAGIKVHCNVQQARADDPRFFPMYEHLVARGKTLVLHGGTQPLRDAFVGMEYARGALDRFPELRMQLAHMGAGEFAEAFALMADFPNVTMDISIIFNDRAPFFPRECFDDVIKFKDRILYGSDFPNIWYPPEAGAAAFLECGFPEDVVRKILYENAMGIPGVA
jgi:uncharacterized protein